MSPSFAEEICGWHPCVRCSRCGGWCGSGCRKRPRGHDWPICRVRLWRWCRGGHCDANLRNMIQIDNTIWNCFLMYLNTKLFVKKWYFNTKTSFSHRIKPKNCCKYNSTLPCSNQENKVKRETKQFMEFLWFYYNKTLH